MHVIIMGPQGSGKGTQAALLVKKYGIVHISTGDIFRENIAHHTSLGQEAKSYIEQGKLVPDDLTNRLVADKLSQSGIRNGRGWILDGYPRNAEQVQALDTTLASLGEKIDAVMVLTAPQEELMRRLAHRAQEEGRSDDTADAIAQRLAIYEKETKPLIDIYKQRGIVHIIDGTAGIEPVLQMISDIVDKL